MIWEYISAYNMLIIKWPNVNIIASLIKRESIGREYLHEDCCAASFKYDKMQ